jgi:hypothetical protein
MARSSGCGGDGQGDGRGLEEFHVEGDELLIKTNVGATRAC